jgi:putative tricarboxylic transport membrane protein
MFDGLIAFGQSLASFATPLSLFYVAVSSLIGLVIGALPGLTATMGLTLMTTMTLSLPPAQALLILICTYVGAIYGGSRSAILLNIPGTPASAAACLDGHALARQGLAGRAMGIATSGSVLGTLIGMFFLAWFTPVLGEVALKFGAYEFFWLAFFGVIISGTLTGDDPLKGWIAGIAGLFVSGIGQEAIYAFDRFTFGNRRVRPRGAPGHDEDAPATGRHQSVRLGGPEAPRCRALLEDDRPLRLHRYVHWHHSRRRRGRRRMDVVCRGQAREQGARDVRQGLD